MNATTQARIDFMHDIDTRKVSPESRQYAREQARKLIGIVKNRKRPEKVLTIKACAERLGIGHWAIQGWVKRNYIWHGFVDVWSERNGRKYRTATVDVDEVRDYLASREQPEPVPEPEIETPPEGWVSAPDLHQMTAIRDDLILNWCRANEIPSQKYLIQSQGRRRYWCWHATLDDVCAAFRRTRESVIEKGGYLKRDTSIPVTPLIRELWHIRDIAPEVAAAWEELRK